MPGVVCLVQLQPLQSPLRGDARNQRGSGSADVPRFQLELANNTADVYLDLQQSYIS